MSIKTTATNVKVGDFLYEEPPFHACSREVLGIKRCGKASVKITLRGYTGDVVVQTKRKITTVFVDRKQ
jgi:hypothetical protein